MKVLLVSHGFPPDQMAGAEIYTYNIARALIERGVDVAVFAAAQRDDPAEYALIEEDVDGIATYRFINRFNDLVDLESTYRNAEAERAYREVLDRVRPDVVHVHHVIGTSVAVIPMARNRGIPVCVTLHDFWFQCARGQRMTPRGHLCEEVQPWRCASCIGGKRIKYALGFARSAANGTLAEARGEPGWRRGLMLLPRMLGHGLREGYTRAIRRRLESMEAALLSADLIISPSEFLRQEFISRGVPEDQIICSENGMETSRFDGVQHPSGRPERIRFGFVGTLIPTKGVELLIKAWKTMPVGRASLDLHGDGGGPFGARYKDRLVARNRHPDVTFHGRYDNRDVAKIFESIDVLVLPSTWYENAPLTLNEAALAGRPVITADHGGMKEFADRFGTAVTFKAGDANDLERVMRRFLDDQGLYERLLEPRSVVRSIEDDADATEARYRLLLEPPAG